MTKSITVCCLFAAAASFLLPACAEAQYSPRQGPSSLSLVPRVQLTMVAPRTKPPLPHLGVDARITSKGCLLTAVTHGGKAWQAGLEPGDTILAVNGEHIKSSDDWDRILRASLQQGCLVLAVHDWREDQIAYRRIPVSYQGLNSGGSTSNSGLGSGNGSNHGPQYPYGGHHVGSNPYPGNGQHVGGNPYPGHGQYVGNSGPYPGMPQVSPAPPMIFVPVPGAPKNGSYGPPHHPQQKLPPGVRIANGILQIIDGAINHQ